MRKIKDYMSETEAREIVSRLVKRKPFNTTSLKDEIEENKRFKIRDLEILPSSKTVLRWRKIVNNIVSHQENDVEHYAEGFTVIKSVKPALFINTKHL
jgi:hypothetical protein